MATKKKPKSAQVKKIPAQMSLSASARKMGRVNKPTRLVLSCTEDEKVYIKMLALREGKTASEYLLSFARQNMPKHCDHPGCDGIHKPNKLTEKTLRESERGENLEHFETLEDFWKSMGIDPNAED